MPKQIAYRVYTVYVHREEVKQKDINGKTVKRPILSLRTRSIDVALEPDSKILESHIVRRVMKDGGITYLEDMS